MTGQDDGGAQSGLLWMMGLRVLVVTLFLGLYFVLFPAPAFSALIAVTYLATILYALLYRLFPLPVSAYLQTFGDLSLITALIAMTGGVESPFVFLYLISIIAAGVESPFVFLYLISIISAGILISRVGALAAASGGSVLFGTVVDAQYFHLFPFLPTATLSGSAIFYVLFLNMVAFFAVAYLGSSLTVSLHRMKEELREKASNLGDLQSFNENVARSMSSGLLTTDLEGRITSFNRAAEEITGYTIEEVTGKFWGTVFPLKEIHAIFHSKDHPASRWRFDGEILRKDGKHRIVGVTVSILKDESGQDKGVIGIFQDLTQIVEMETEVKKREKMAMVGELAAGMAHEIRNPLASLSGSLQILKKELPIDGENARLMDIALRETDRLNVKMTEFLAYARPAPLKKKRCDLHGLLRDTLDLLKNNEEYRAEVVIDAPLEEDLPALVDPNQISQVFWNLALNALQAMPGGGALTVTSRRLRGAGGEAEIVFRDTGEGVDVTLLDKIFVPFFTTKEKGTGLGLSIVHRIVEEHGGRIRVAGTPGRGAEFRIYLPLGGDGG
ncbi:MAG: PAS domain S-box protein [Nitrospirae bacterium]|nr:PAS domain S-box protein [Nitrospirota bacterium]